MIYLDNSATTTLSQNVKNDIINNLDCFGNPSSAYDIGVKSHNIIENTRNIVAKTINCKPNEVYFTSGASESNSWALQKPFYCNDYEHHSILNNKNKVCTTERAEIIEQMYVNNEIGFINDIRLYRKQFKDKIFHCDATQAMGNIKVDVKKLDVDTLSFSGHKIHAPKGVGVLYIRNGYRLKPLIYGGKQEKYMRGGTENILGISALGVALEEFCTDNAIKLKNEHCTKLRNLIIDKLKDEFVYGEDFIINQKENNISSILSLSFKNIQSESILLYLETKGIYISSGSACTTGETEPSETLKYMQIPNDFINGTIRISLSLENDYLQVTEFINSLIYIVSKLKSKN